MRSVARKYFFLAFCLSAAAAGLRGATYLPMRDADLARQAPVIAVARVLDERVTLQQLRGVDHPFTTTTFRTLEALKGTVPDVFEVTLPGGMVGEIAWQIPGTPSFTRDRDVILFLAPRDDAAPEAFRLTEFGLSRFDLVEDASGRRFAVRPAFGAASDDSLSGREPQAVTAGAAEAENDASRPRRELDSFLCALRASGSGAEFPPVQYGEPEGQLRVSGGGAGPLWVNIGGREPGNCGGTPCLFRWFWDTGASPDGVIKISGTQTNLSDASGGSPHVQNAVDKWRTVAGSNVRYSGVSVTGNVDVILDAPESQDDGSTWSSPSRFVMASSSMPLIIVA